MRRRMRPTVLHRVASRAALTAYAGLSEFVVSPLAAAFAYRKGGISAVRQTLAMCGAARPGRPASCSYMLWVHGASIGETITALPIVRKLLASDDRAMAVITSNTATALARLSLERLGPRVVLRHQPADARSVVRRFLRCWQPDGLLLVESELWPNLLLQASTSRLPVALVNAHISRSSFERWRAVAPLTLQTLLASCAVILAKSPAMVERLHLAGSERALYRGDLKQLRGALSPSATMVASLQDAMGERRAGDVWLAASTHEGEEEVLLQAHASLRRAHPSTLLLLVPRHPERGKALAAMAQRFGLEVSLCPAPCSRSRPSPSPSSSLSVTVILALPLALALTTAFRVNLPKPPRSRCALPLSRSQSVPPSTSAIRSASSLRCTV